MTGRPRYRTRTIANSIIGLSISYQHDDLLSRGLGLDHLRELLIRLARPLLRHGASLSYGGHWKETEDNFTFDLLRLISGEMSDNVGEDGDDAPIASEIGKLFSYCAWPGYLDITKRTEAQWINCCRILRIDQKRAKLEDPETVAAHGPLTDSPRAVFNAAVTLSAMRRLSMTGIQMTIAEAGRVESVPGMAARIMLGGKVDGFTGFAPGIFEEALVTLEAEKPLYILGGFGGAAKVLADAIRPSPTGDKPQQFDLPFHLKRTPRLSELLEHAKTFDQDGRFRTTEALLTALYQRLKDAADNPQTALRTGLDKAETEELMTTSYIGRAVKLVTKGLTANNNLPTVPA